MKKLAAIISLWLALGAFAPAFAANVNIDALPAAASVGGTDLLECEQAGTNRKCTAAQTAAYVYGLMSGDATTTGLGAITFATVNANVGSFGNATNCVTLTVNAKGLITAASAATCTPAVGSITGLGTGVGTALGTNVGTAGSVVVNGGALGTPSSGTGTNLTGIPISTGISGLGTGVATFLATPSSANLLSALTTKTGTGNAVFGSAPTIDSLNATTAMTLAFLTGGGTQCLTVSNTGAVGATACSGGGSVTGVTPGGGLVSGTTASCTQTAITVSGTLSAAECIDARTTTTETINDSDRGNFMTASNSSAQAYSIARAGTASNFANGWCTRLKNINTGVVVVTPTTSTINGAASLSVFPGQGIKLCSDGTNYTATFEAPTAVALATQSGSNYAFKSGDYGTVVNLSNGSNQIPTIPQAGTTGFPAGWYVTACNIGAGSQTLTPSTSTIGGASTYVLRAGSAAAPVCATVISDGTNYSLVVDAGYGTLSGAVKASGGQLSQAACADLSNGTALCSTTPGTGVATAAANNLSAAGGLTSTIASGTSALGTGAISSATCATVVTTSAPNTATTDVVLASFNGDPTAVTGYVPLTTGMLTIIAYPTSGNVNFKVCNNTSSSITPGAITLNWRVVR